MPGAERERTLPGLHACLVDETLRGRAVLRVVNPRARGGSLTASATRREPRACGVRGDQLQVELDEGQGLVVARSTAGRSELALAARRRSRARISAY